MDELRFLSGSVARLAKKTSYCRYALELRNARLFGNKGRQSHPKSIDISLMKSWQSEHLMSYFECTHLLQTAQHLYRHSNLCCRFSYPETFSFIDITHLYKVCISDERGVWPFIHDQLVPLNVALEGSGVDLKVPCGLRQAEKTLLHSIFHTFQRSYIDPAAVPMIGNEPPQQNLWADSGSGSRP